MIWTMLFSGGALVCGALVWISALRTVTRVEDLAPITRVTALGDVSTGSPVLLQGRLSARNPIQLDAYGFAAFVCEGRATTDARGTPTAGNWSVRERVTPPVWLDLSGGAVWITNDDYALEQGRTIELAPVGAARHSDTRYSGLAPGDPVIAVGVLTARGAQPTLKADFLARGTREDYVASQRNAGVIFFALGVLVALGGALVIGGSALRCAWKDALRK